MPKRVLTKVNIFLERISRGVFMLLVIVTAFVMVLLYLENVENRIALCKFRTDLDVRIAFSEKLISDAAPDAAKIQGIDREVIVASLNNSIRTRMTLGDLRCGRFSKWI